MFDRNVLVIIFFTNSFTEKKKNRNKNSVVCHSPFNSNGSYFLVSQAFHFELSIKILDLKLTVVLNVFEEFSEN